MRLLGALPMVLLVATLAGSAVVPSASPTPLPACPPPGATFESATPLSPRVACRAERPGWYVNALEWYKFPAEALDLILLQATYDGGIRAFFALHKPDGTSWQSGFSVQGGGVGVMFPGSTLAVEQGEWRMSLRLFEGPGSYSFALDVVPTGAAG